MWLTIFCFYGIIIFYLVKALKFLIKHIYVLIVTFKLPGPPMGRNILFGNSYGLTGEPEEMHPRLRRLAKDYYPLYQLWVFPYAVVNLLSPEDIELVITNSQHNTKSLIYETFRKWLGDGLLISKEQKWQKRRHILTPAFHLKSLRDFVEVFNEETNELVQMLKEQTDKPIDISKHVFLLTLKTITETAMGSKVNTKGAVGDDYRKAVEEIGELLAQMPTRPWRLSRILYFLTDPKTFLKELNLLKVLKGFSKNLIRKREREFVLDNDQNKRMAMLDILIRSKRIDKTIDDEGIQEEVDTFMFAGHDTTAIALSFCLMLLACNKHVQDKIFDEIQQILGDKEPTLQDLQNLKYMEMSIQESLRLYPSAPLISRVLGADLVTTNGSFIPKNTTVFMLIYDLHHNANIYPDPEKFDPDRFLPDNVKNRHHFAYLPFSGGARNCIGQRFALLEMKAVLCGILRNFILMPIDTPETIILMADIVLRSKNCVKLKLLPRK